MNSTFSGRNESINPMIIDSSQNTGTVYVCGCNYIWSNLIACGNDNEIRPKESIQCKDCGGRIFYKKRTRRLVQYEAR